METFKSLSWNVPIEVETDFASAEHFKSMSVAYKLMHESYKEPSSDSSDEPSVKFVRPKGNAKMKKKKKKKKTIQKSGKDKGNDKEMKNNGAQIVTNDDGVRYSSFTTAQHASFVKMLQSVQNQMTNIPSQWLKMKEAVEAEQAEFLEHIKDLWKSAYERHNVLSDDAQRFTEDEWKAQLKRVKSYSQFYKQNQKIPLVYAAERPEVQMMPLQMLLEMGVVPKLLVSYNNMSNKLSTDYSKMLLLNARTAADVHSLHQIPVSCDKNAEVLAVKERAHVVISSSALKCIADNIPPKFLGVWNIPVIVKQYNVQDGNSLKSQKVVYIDKRLPAKSMSASERNSWFHKLAVKTFLFHHKDTNAFSYPENHYISHNVKYTNWDEPALLQNGLPDSTTEIPCKNCKVHTGNKKKYQDVNMDMDDDSSDSSSLVIDTSPEDVNISESQTDVCTCDKRSQKINTVDNNTSATSECTEYATIPPSSKTNVTYRLWKLHCEERNKEELNEKFLKGQSSNTDLRVLVRCKMDACVHENNNVIPVCVSSKLEYQTEYGAEKVTLSSLVREWVNLFFRPEAGLRRIRINAVTEDVIMTEKIVLRDLALMASHLYNFHIRRTVLGSLYQVLSELVNLKPGHYMLSHDLRDGPFVCVFQHTNEYYTYDLYADYESINPGIVMKDEVPQWTSIDTNLITPLHSTAQRIPATFEPHK